MTDRIPIESPCVSACRLDPGGLCVGCRRSKEEIGNWTKYTDVERKQRMSELPAR